MIEIYFDDKLIDEDSYTALSNNFELFGSNFELGSTASNNFSLSIMEDKVSKQPKTIKIFEDKLLKAVLEADNIEKDNGEYQYKLTDKMIDLNFNYDASEIFENGCTTLGKIAEDICNKAEIELGTKNFRGYNKEISWYDNTVKARKYVQYIAELNGGYAQIGADGKLYFFKQNMPSVKTINLDECEDYKIGDKKVITRVVFEQGTLKYEFGDESGNTLYLNSDNVFITEKSEVEEIYNEIKGFTFYNFETATCPIDSSIRAGQIVTFTDGTNEYPTIVGYELTFYGEWYGGYSLSIDSTKQEETKEEGTEEKFRKLNITVDRNTNRIKQLIQEKGEYEERITKTEQDVDGIKQTVSETIDYKREKEGNTEILLENSANAEILKLEIRGNKSYENYMYPQSEIFPSEENFSNMEVI